MNVLSQEAEVAHPMSTHTYQVMDPTVADRQEKIARGMTVGDEMIEIEIGWTMMTAVGAGELVVAVEVQRESAIGRGLANESRWIGIGSGKFIAGEPAIFLEEVNKGMALQMFKGR